MSAIAWDLGAAESHAPRPCLRLVAQTGGRGSQPVSRTPAAVYRRRRAVAGAVVIAAAIAMGAAVAPATGAPVDQGPSAGAVEPARIVVGPGDTLWDLAAPHAPAGADTMAYVVEVAAFNGVDPRAVRPGTVLRLPAAN